jgi:hypothetical protein
MQGSLDSDGGAKGGGVSGRDSANNFVVDLHWIEVEDRRQEDDRQGRQSRQGKSTVAEP